jgi:AAA domain
VTEWEVPHGPSTRVRLTEDQQRAVLEGLGTRVQLLKRPPGTGKTVTTATSILTKAAATLRVGTLVPMAAHTHQAVNTLLQRLSRPRDSYQQEARRHGLTPAPVIITKVHTSDPPPDADGILNFKAAPSATRVNSWLHDGVLLIGGTAGALLRMAEELSGKNPFR